MISHIDHYLNITVGYLGNKYLEMNFLNYNIDITDFELLPWHRSEVDEDIKAEYGDTVLNNYAGWLWFVITYKSVPIKKQFRELCYNISMDAKDRMKAWKELPEPKPSWESFKVMLRNFNNDPFKAHQAFLKKERKMQAEFNNNHSQDL